MAATPQSNKSDRRWKRLLAVCALLAVVTAGITFAVRLANRPQRKWSATDVPLGVEEAVIIRYSGPRLVARPYRRGASVNLRIAAETHRPRRLASTTYAMLSTCPANWM